jgi:hypothetical protein
MNRAARCWCDESRLVAWHDQFDTPGRHCTGGSCSCNGASARRSAAPPGPILVISVCAGQGRDLLGVLPDRRTDVAHGWWRVDDLSEAIADRVVRQPLGRSVAFVA